MTPRTPVCPIPGGRGCHAPRASRPRAWSRLGAAAAVVALTLACAASPAAAAPDLFVDSLQANPDAGPNGTAVAISIRIRNQGDEAADETVTRVRINQDPGAVVSTDPQICNLQTPAILAGGFADVACTPVLSGRPPGANYIWAIADVNNSAGQDDRTNDRLSDLFTVNDQASDLVVQNIVLDPASARNGDPVIMTITLRNQGTAIAASSVTRLRINQDASTVESTDLQICNITTPNIPPGASAAVSCTPTISGRPPGTNYVWVIADVNNTAGQADRTNDRASAPLEVSSVASDLIVESVVANPTAGGNGDPITITATIRNQGNATAFASITRFRINEDPNTVGGGDFQLCPPVETKSIPVGQTTEVKCKTTLEDRPSGPNYIWAIADTSDTAGQSDRTNDRGKVEFVIDPPPTPDLSVRTITVNPVSGANGDTLTISARIGNEGDLASPATKARFTINQDADDTVEGDTVLCNEVSVVALSPGASVQVSCKPVLLDRPLGLHHVWATADATGVAAQVNFDNDELAAEFTVTPVPGPDLVVENVTALPSSAKAGQAVSVTVRIRNQGNESASSSTARVRLGRSAAGVLETDEILCNAV
ncbi:MAG: CARDB domain-containing protein, partial [Candidatus Binatia bacterium]